jgi:hypothetical protein
VVTVKAFRSAFGIILPISGGSLVWWIHGKTSASFYVLGLALGLIVTYVYPRRTSQYSLDDVCRIVQMSDDLQMLRDIEKRSLLILASIFPPKRVTRQEGITQEEYAKQLEEAADAFKNDTIDDQPVDGGESSEEHDGNTESI